MNYKYGYMNFWWDEILILRKNRVISDVKIVLFFFRVSKRRSIGRFKKYIGDLCMLVGVF